MNIFKKGWVGALALTAAAMLTSPVMAAYGYKIGAATVDDVTTTACTTAAGQSVDMFGNGADMDMVWALEVEVGSKGSGAWTKVSGFTDVFPTASSATTQVSRTTSPSPNGDCYRLRS